MVILGPLWDLKHRHRGNEFHNFDKGLCEHRIHEFSSSLLMIGRKVYFFKDLIHVLNMAKLTTP